ncbi:hypothetical protein [Streptomyces otsuchiensis]|uniref:hypothetical protein n=1 Tax=Streptomyces otsuchiensis TaxID=2681388 RepID=UPI001031E669|nr:hypothetical protein [Streptomyces otsuchiensis]
MPIDPSEPDSVEEVLASERTPSGEAPEADTAEERAASRARQERVGAEAGVVETPGGAADPADVIEQTRTVERGDEDEYR